MDPPSAMQNRRASNSESCNSRPWVLVDTISRIGRRRNATTAETLTSRGFPVQVSFELADPPGVSLFIVHCPGRNERHNFVGDPLILSSAQAFLLLVISFTVGASHQNWFHDYFVYKAGPGRPRLDLIPMPYPRDYDHKQVGILPLGDGAVSDHYAVVLPVPSYNYRARSMNFSLRVFWSESKSWTTKEALLARDSETDILVVSNNATRVISVGGGVLGWVDLWSGILLCNVLDENPLMRLMQWPVEPSDEVFELGWELNHISPRPYRDVAVVNGLIKFVEMPLERAANRGWTATIWSRMVSSQDWHQSSTVHADDISIPDSTLMDRIQLLLPEMFDEEAKRLTWDQVMCTSPTLSLTNDDVVHIMVFDKLDYPRAYAYLLVVNIRNKALEALEKFHANRMILLEPTYIGCAFPSYLDTTATM